MILVNELRVGNWIYNPVQKIFFQADIQTISNVWYDNQKGDTRNKDLYYQPIPLTEDIFLKCGFIEKKEYNCYVLDTPNSKSQIIIRIEDYVLCDINIKVQLKHLHQLQNLYFVLTAKELEVNL